MILNLDSEKNKEREKVSRYETGSYVGLIDFQKAFDREVSGTGRTTKRKECGRLRYRYNNKSVLDSKTKCWN